MSSRSILSSRSIPASSEYREAGLNAHTSYTLSHTFPERTNKEKVCEMVLTFSGAPGLPPASLQCAGAQIRLRGCGLPWLKQGTLLVSHTLSLTLLVLCTLSPLTQQRTGLGARVECRALYESNGCRLHEVNLLEGRRDVVEISHMIRRKNSQRMSR